MAARVLKAGILAFLLAIATWVMIFRQGAGSPQLGSDGQRGVGGAVVSAALAALWFWASFRLLRHPSWLLSVRFAFATLLVFGSLWMLVSPGGPFNRIHEDQSNEWAFGCLLMVIGIIGAASVEIVNLCRRQK